MTTTPTQKDYQKRPVVMLANGHPTFDTRIFIKEAQTLFGNGYQVSIIIPHTHDEQRGGISILSVPPIRSGFGKLVISPWNILKRAVKQSSQSVFHIHDSDILLVGVFLKLMGRKVIYDAHEDTPLQISYQHWLPGILKKPYAWFYFLLEKFCGWIFDAIIVAEPVIAKYFPTRKTYLVRNFPMASSFQDHSLSPYNLRTGGIIHVGTLSEVRGLFEMLEGAKLAADKVDFQFVLGGKFTPAGLEKRVLDSYSVNYISWVSYSDLVDLLFKAEVGIIIPHPIKRYKTNYPVKMFEFMGAGLPVIASREGESAVFIEEAKCGILVNPKDTLEIGSAIEWLLTYKDEAEAMGQRGQELIFKKYSWENEAKVLLEVYNNL